MLTQVSFSPGGPAAEKVSPTWRLLDFRSNLVQSLSCPWKGAYTHASHERGIVSDCVVEEPLVLPCSRQVRKWAQQDVPRLPGCFDVPDAGRDGMRDKLEVVLLYF